MKKNLIYFLFVATTLFGCQSNPDTEGSNETVLARQRTLALVIKPRIQRRQHARGSGFDIPGFRRAEVILDEGANRRLAGHLRVVAAAHPVGDGGYCAFVEPRLPARQDGSKCIFVALFGAHHRVAAVGDAKTAGGTAHAAETCVKALSSTAFSVLK